MSVPRLDVFQPFDQDIEVNGLRGIEVVLASESSGALFRCKRLVEAVHGQDHYPWQAQFLDDGIGKRGLSRARATSYADDRGVGPWRSHKDFMYSTRARRSSSEKRSAP